jgi:Arc/MetJ-type ribon-helix-helix transcriptional regulator
VYLTTLSESTPYSPQSDFIRQARKKRKEKEKKERKEKRAWHVAYMENKFITDIIPESGGNKRIKI